MKFKVPVCRTEYAFASIEVEADSAEEAKQKALEVAGDHVFYGKSADYSVEAGAQEIE